METYTAYGLSIRADMPLPGLMPGDGDARDADVLVCLGHVDAPAPIAADGEWGARVEPQEVRLVSPETGRFLIRGGRAIVVDPDPGAPERAVVGVVTGLAMGILLHQRGLLVLHASAVAVDGSAVIILGDPGAGKSTLAAALHGRGHGILSDDVSGIDVNGAEPTVRPAYPQMKLCRDAITFLGCTPEAPPCGTGDPEKRTCFVARRFGRAAPPLRRIHLLADGSRQSIQPLRQREAFLELVRHSCVGRLLKASNTASRHFRQCAAVAKRVGFCRLRRVRRLSALPDLAALVEGDLQQT
jgi:hypothetical protein